MNLYSTAIPTANPCSTTVCGPNSQCRETNNQAVCSCWPTYLGIPPACRPECVINSECSQNQACMKQKCVNPCIGVCGIRATCEVINHNPICACPPAHTGDPFVQCTFFTSKLNLYTNNATYMHIGCFFIFKRNTIVKILYFNFRFTTSGSKSLSAFSMWAKFSM